MPPPARHRFDLSGPRRAAVAAVVATLCAGAAELPAMQIAWRSLDVAARIEADGALAVTETHAIVLDGDWNGPERSFRLEAGQRLEIERMVRLDPATGVEQPLEEGELDRVDRWALVERTKLRWRSRLPTDPPFRSELLVYRIDLRYERIFTAEGDRQYRLAHDFAFADREQPIERFSLELSADPGWRLIGELQLDGQRFAGALPTRFEGGPVAPGSGVVVAGEFAFEGAERPRKAAPLVFSASIRRTFAAVAAAAIVACALGFGFAFLRRDRALGRFVPIPPAEAIDRAFLEDKVFALRPEVVGAAWDRSIGSAEVAAILARLVAEGKIGSRVERSGWGPFTRDVLHLALRVPRERFDADEDSLIAGLFPKGDTTDTESLRAHYSSRGFDPVARVRGQLEKRLRGLTGFAAGAPRPSARLTGLLVLAGLALVIVTPFVTTREPQALVLLAAALVASIPGLIGATLGRSTVGVPRAALVALALSTALAAIALPWLTRLLSLPLVALAGGTLFAIGLVRSMFQTLSTPESEASMARRRELVAARRWFARELEREAPALDDRDFPWLVALGLAPDCDRWARRFGVATAGAASSHGGFGRVGGSSGGAGSFGSGSFGSGAGGWSGGGGAFGGAGATTSFAAAVSTMAAGVPAPSSSGGSSSGGGGGGGGSSSGGGGGGGW